MSFSDLPEDMYHEIASHLTLTDLRNLASFSRFFRDNYSLFKKKLFRWRQVSFNSIGDHPLFELLHLDDIAIGPLVESRRYNLTVIGMMIEDGEDFYLDGPIRATVTYSLPSVDGMDDIVDYRADLICSFKNDMLDGIYYRIETKGGDDSAGFFDRLRIFHSKDGENEGWEFIMDDEKAVYIYHHDGSISGKGERSVEMDTDEVIRRGEVDLGFYELDTITPEFLTIDEIFTLFPELTLDKLDIPKFIERN